MRQLPSIHQYIRNFFIVNITTYTTPKKENTKKIAGNAKKAEAAAQKQAEANAKIAQQEDAEWAKGAKSNAKKEAAAAKAAEAAAKKAERDRLLAAEEASLPSKPKNTGAKVAPKKSKGTLDLSSLDDSPSDTSRKEPTINASGIDNALDALSLTTDPNSQKIERHPYARDLIQSIRDWTKVVDQAHRSLKPGGSFEVACEYLWPFGTPTSAPYCYANYLRQKGFVKVVEKVYKIPS